MDRFSNSIFIVGKSKIAIRHYDILRKIKKTSKIYFISKDQFLLERKKNYFVNTTIKLKKNLSPLLVVIASPSNTHLYYLKYFLNKSNYILIEKPLTNNLKKAVEFFKKIKKKKITSKLLVGYNLRFTKILMKFNKLVSKRVLGKIYFVECNVGKSLLLWRNGNLNFAFTNAKKGGGILLELSHEIDYLLWIFGNLEVENSYINPNKFFNFNVEQNVFATLKAKNFPISLKMDVIRNNPERICKVICKKGIIEMDLIKNKITVLKNKKNQVYKFPKNDLNLSYKYQIKDLLFKRKQNLNDINQSIKVLGIVETIKNEN